MNRKCFLWEWVFNRLDGVERCEGLQSTGVHDKHSSSLPPSYPASLFPSFCFHFCFFKTESYHVVQAGFRLTEVPACAYHQPRVKVVEIPAAELDGSSQDPIS